MLADDKYEHLLPKVTEQFNIKLWQNQKNLITYLLNLENIFIEMGNIKNNILALANKYIDIHKSISVMPYHDKKFIDEIRYSISKVKKIMCICDDVGQGKSYIALTISCQKYDAFEQKLNIIIVPFKLIKQWKTYINNLKVLKYYVINTTKSLNDYTYENEDISILLVSDAFISKVYTQKFNKYNTKIFLRCFVDEYDFVEKKYKNRIEEIFEISKFNYIISSTYICNPPFVPISNDKKYINIHEYPIKYHIIKINTFLKLFEKLSVDDLKILENYDISNYDNSDELFQNIFKTKQDKISNLKKDLLDYIKTIDYRILNKYHIQNVDFKNVLEIFELIKYEKNIENDIYDKIISEINNKNIVNRLISNECNICLMDDKEKIILLCCCNWVCSTCIEQIAICPYCRKDIKMSANTNNMKFKTETKIDKLTKLNFENDSKIVILGNDQEIKMENLQKMSLKWFKNTNIILLKGNSNICNKKIDDFKNDPNNNILYFPDLKSVCGFNLEFVTDLILIGSINSSKKQQIVGRVQRIGRTKPLNIYQFDEK